jgi:hypothetical protein
MANNKDKEAFLVLGHGTEDIIEFEERKEMPPGYTLITVAECGITSSTHEVCPLTEAFLDYSNKNVLLNPVVNKKKIEDYIGGKKIHIYRPGDKYPPLTLQMFLDWNDIDGVEIFKSGTYSFPINRADFEIGSGDNFCDRLFKKIGKYSGFSRKLPSDYDPVMHFSGSIIPSVDNVIEKISESKEKSDVLKEKLMYPLEHIFEKCGPGVYYYVVCRAPKSIKSVANLMELDVLSENRYKKYNVNNWTSKLNEIIPLMEENLNRSSRRYWYHNIIEDTLKDYKKIKKVPRIRRQSIEQQGKGRKTKRKRHTLKKYKIAKNKSIKRT